MQRSLQDFLFLLITSYRFLLIIDLPPHLNSYNLFPVVVETSRTWVIGPSLQRKSKRFPYEFSVFFMALIVFLARRTTSNIEITQISYKGFDKRFKYYRSYVHNSYKMFSAISDSMFEPLCSFSSHHYVVLVSNQRLIASRLEFSNFVSYTMKDSFSLRFLYPKAQQ